MKAQFHRLCKVILGWALVLLGIIGWLLPIVPGTPFVILGLAILSAQSEWLKNKFELIKARYPHQVARLQALKEHFAARIRKAWTF